MEYATNGSLGSTTTAYSFGVQRESFVETTAGMGAGATMGGMTYQSSGTYYYTGTGSVANVTGSATNQSYSYTASGSMTAFAMNASATSASGSGITGTSTLTTNPTAYGTYGVYGYNGEYTHTSLGLQYLRARYLNVATGTFTSRDTYAGKLQDILSQNRYTYAENNPVGHSDPGGHAVKSGISSILKKAANTIKAAVTGQSSGNVKKGNTANATMRGNLYPEIRNINSGIDKKKENAQISEGRTNLLKASVGNVAGALIHYGPSIINKTPTWIQSLAVQVEYRNCATYDYCQNKMQQIIEQKGIQLVKIDNWIKTNIPGYSILGKTPQGIVGKKILDMNDLYIKSLKPAANHENEENLPDYTDIIQARMDQTVEEYNQYIEENGWFSAAYKYYNDVKTGGSLDIKNPEAWSIYFKGTEIEQQPTSFVFRGEAIDPGILGNQTYGYLGKQIGFPQVVLYLGGGWAQLQNASRESKTQSDGSILPEDEVRSKIEAFSCWFLPNWGDAPEDHEDVKAGMEWYMDSLIN